MPQPKEICLEDLNLSPDDDRYIRCVALPGGEPGLALDREGAVRWMPDEACAYGLWISADDRLVLLRAEGTSPITVLRGGRSQEAPCDKPVILLDGDLLSLDDRRFRVHIHGETELVYPPAPTSRSGLARAARAATAGLALGAAVAAGGPAPADAATTGDVARSPIEVRARPPAPPPMRQVDCTIKKQIPGKKGPLVLHATCSKKSGAHVGARGQLLDPKNIKPIKNGAVVIKKVKGDDIIVEAGLLKKSTKATTMRFYIY